MSENNISTTPSVANVTLDTYALVREDLYRASIVPLALIMTGAIIGIFGNGWFSMLLIVTKPLRKPHYKLLLGVILYDFFTNLLFIPFETGQTMIFLKTGVIWAEEICGPEQATYMSIAYGSMLGQFLIAINRGMAVFKPVLYRQVCTNRFVTIQFLIFATLVPFAFFFVQYQWSIGYIMDYKLGDCTPTYYNPVAKYSKAVVLHYIPTFGSLLCYVGIFGKIVMASKTERKEVIRRAKGSLTMCLCMLYLAVMLCLVPITTAMGLYLVNPYVTLYANLLFRSSFSVNPFFYLFSGELRKCSVDFIKVKILGRKLDDEDASMTTDKD